MRHLLAFLLMLPVFAWGQTSLPRCTAAETDLGARRHNCFGARTDRNGAKYVGEFRDGKENGQGILYRPDGSIARSGRWENSVFVQQLALDTNPFPFDASRPPQSTLPLSPSPTSPRPPLSSVAASVESKTCSNSEDYYPQQSKKLNETGTVVLRFFVEPDGTLGKVEVVRSSGFDRLDTAAQKLLRTCTFRPAIVQGKSARGVSTLEVVWKLDKQSVANISDRDRLAAEAERNRLATMTRPQPQRDSASSGHSSLPACTAAETDWRAERHNCFGTVTSPDGSKYVGEFRDGRWTGQATWTHPSGEKYVGEYWDDLRHGQGILYGANGSIAKSGRWESGRMVQEFALDPNRFPFNSPVADAGKAERDRLAAELEAERKKRAEAEARQLSETRERERLASEAEAERKKRQDLEEQLAKQERPSVSPPPTASAPRNPHALVIGNAAYPGSGRLDNPINDAQAISQKLRAIGFTVTVVSDANRQRLVQAMSQFRKSASAADLSLLFYSGHGVQIFGTNYILPIDADQSDVAQATIHGISLNSVVENFLPGKTKIVFLDACRDNPLQRAGDRSVSKGLAPISVAQGTLISYATKDGQTASDGVGQKNSPFTTALLQHLSDPEDIAVVLRKVREKVMAATGGKQQPKEYGSLTGGALVLSAIKR